MKKTALITGAGRRIGKAIALKLAGQGYSIALHYHTSKNQAQALCREIQLFGVRCIPFKCDLSRENQVRNLIPNIVRKMPDLEVVINNASFFERRTFLETEIDDFSKVFNINFKAPFFICRDFARTCRKGHIINILDTKISSCQSAYFVYTLSKKILASFTEMAAKTLGPQIRVNSIAPGLILPPAGENDKYMNIMAKKLPLRRKGNVSNITDTIEGLLNNDFITGQCIFVDGGQRL
ncbi:MAG: SDR family oxidoreductase [bacterium]